MRRFFAWFERYANTVGENGSIGISQYAISFSGRLLADGKCPAGRDRGRRRTGRQRRSQDVDGEDSGHAGSLHAVAPLPEPVAALVPSKVVRRVGS